MAIIYNKYDVFQARRNANTSSFEEYILRANPNSIVMFDSASGLVSIPTGSVTVGTASYSLNGIQIGGSYDITSSYAVSSLSASYCLSGSYFLYTYHNITQSITYIESASWASSSISASYAPIDTTYSASVSSIKQNVLTNTTYTITSSWSNNSISSSLALTAQSSSFSLLSTNAVNSTSASIANTSSYILPENIANNYSSSVSSLISNKQNTLTGGGNYTITSSWAITASYAMNGGGTGVVSGGSYNISTSFASSSLSASYSLLGNLDGGNASGVVDEGNVFSGSYITASYAITASYVLNGGGTGVVSGGSYNISTSFASGSLSSSYIFPGNIGNNYSSSVSTIFGTKQDNLVTGNNYTITSSWANNSLSSSYIFPGNIGNNYSSSVSTIFGTKQDNLITGNVYLITSSFCISGSYFSYTYYNVTESMTYISSASWASASISSSYILPGNIASNYSSSVSSLIGQKQNTLTNTLYTITASLATSASYAPGGSGVTDGGSYNISASYASSSLSSSYSLYAQTLLGNVSTANFATIATSASYASRSLSSSYILPSNIHSLLLSSPLTNPNELSPKVVIVSSRAEQIFNVLDTSLWLNGHTVDPSGSIDSTDGIQDVIDAAKTFVTSLSPTNNYNGQNAVVYFPPGVYKVTAKMTTLFPNVTTRNATITSLINDYINSKTYGVTSILQGRLEILCRAAFNIDFSNVTIRGAGMYNSKIYTTDGDTNIFVVSNAAKPDYSTINYPITDCTDKLELSEISFEDLGFYNSSKQTPSVSEASLFDNNHFIAHIGNNVKTSATDYNNYYIYDLNIKNCFFLDSNTVAVNFEGCKKINVTDNKFVYFSSKNYLGLDMWSQKTASLVTSFGENVWMPHLSGSTITGAQVGIGIQNSENGIFSRNFFSGYEYDIDSNGNEVLGQRTKYNGANGFFYASYCNSDKNQVSSNFIISDNVILNSCLEGIQSTAFQTTVTNNFLYSDSNCPPGNCGIKLHINSDLFVKTPYFVVNNNTICGCYRDDNSYGSQSYASGYGGNGYYNFGIYASTPASEINLFRRFPNTSSNSYLSSNKSYIDTNILIGNNTISNLSSGIYISEFTNINITGNNIYWCVNSIIFGGFDNYTRTKNAIVSNNVLSSIGNCIINNYSFETGSSFVLDGNILTCRAQVNTIYPYAYSHMTMVDPTSNVNGGWYMNFTSNGNIFRTRRDFNGIHGTSEDYDCPPVIKVNSGGVYTDINTRNNIYFNKTPKTITISDTSQAFNKSKYLEVGDKIILTGNNNDAGLGYNYLSSSVDPFAGSDLRSNQNVTMTLSASKVTHYKKPYEFVVTYPNYLKSNAGGYLSERYYEPVPVYSGLQGATFYGVYELLAVGGAGSPDIELCPTLPGFYYVPVSVTSTLIGRSNTAGGTALTSSVTPSTNLNFYIYSISQSISKPIYSVDFNDHTFAAKRQNEINSTKTYYYKPTSINAALTFPYYGFGGIHSGSIMIGNKNKNSSDDEVIDSDGATKPYYIANDGTTSCKVAVSLHCLVVPSTFFNTTIT